MKKIPYGYSMMSYDLTNNEWLFRDRPNQAHVYRIRPYSVPTEPFEGFHIAKLEDVKRVACDRI